jgi:hypothetical protein
MRKSLVSLTIFITLSALLNQTEAQVNWQQFRMKAENYYYYLEQSGLQNFSCNFTTDSYLNFIEKYADSTYNYPLKMIWTRAGKIYYVLESYPTTKDKIERKDIMQRIQLTKNQFQGFYLDWLNFLMISPFVDIPDEAKVDFIADTVKVRYSSPTDSTTRVSKIFLKSGRLLKVLVESHNDKVFNYPQYQEVAGKWICTGWDSQIIKDGQVRSGLATRLELTKFQEYWMPIRADILVQTVEKPDQKYLSTLFLKGYNFDIPIQKLETPADTSRSTSK